MKVPSSRIIPLAQVPKAVQYEYLFLPDAQPTQMITLPIKSSATIEDASSADGTAWDAVLNQIEASPGYQRLYWGRHVEREDRVQLHIVRDKSRQNKEFLVSPAFKQIVAGISTLAPSDADLKKDIIVRHASLNDQSSGSCALGKGAPYTGTAIYYCTSRRGRDAVWQLWSTIVPTVPGCMGVSGGWISDEVAIPGAQTKAKGGQWKNCFVAWVGWESREAHDAFHHTKEFQRRGAVLGEHNMGFSEYGHVSFTHERSKWDTVARL